MGNPTGIGTQDPVVSQIGAALFPHRLVIVGVAGVSRKQEEFLGGVGGAVSDAFGHGSLLDPGNF